MPFYQQVTGYYNKLDTGTHRKSFFQITATLILLIVLIFMIYPAIKHITEVNKEISDARVVKSRLEDKIDNLATAKNNLEEVQGDLPLLDLALPVGSDLTSYLKKIEGLAANNGLKITAVQFSQVPLSKQEHEVLTTQSLAYSITLEGAFPDFRKFLFSLEGYIRITDVPVINSFKDPTGGLKSTLNAKSYYMGVSNVTTGNANTSQTSLTGNGGAQ